MTEQKKLERVIEALKCITSSGNDGMKDDCASCLYSGGGDCLAPALHDALALLEAYEPRVMTWEEVQASVEDGPFIIIEVRDSTGIEVDFGVLVDDCYEMSDGSLLTVEDFWMLKDEYDKRFRMWTSSPTDEQREAIPWN